MDFKKVSFLKGAVQKTDYPKSTLPEVAFMGASNVGKSSLLNAVWGRKNVAYVSKKPGKTREINFFSVDDIFMAVDLPGYGYAPLSDAQKQLWSASITHYLTTRTHLAHIFLLIDSRHPPKKGDINAALWLKKLTTPFTFLLTKSDKSSASQKAENKTLWEEILKNNTEFIDVSIHDKNSIVFLRRYLLRALKKTNAKKTHE